MLLINNCFLMAIFNSCLSLSIFNQQFLIGPFSLEIFQWPFSKHRPSEMSVCPCVRLSVRLFVSSLLRYRLNVFLPPLPEVGCPIFLEIRNPLGKVMERSGLRFEHFCLKWSKIAAQNIFFVVADFTLQNMVETTLPDGLETPGRKAYR